MKIYDCLIIGAGPCGIGAALKLKEYGVNSAIIECGAPGGKVNICPRVDNYPRQHEIPGPDLAMIFYQRALENSVEIISEEVISLTKDNFLFKLECMENSFYSKTVLIASGTKERKIGLAKEDEFLGKGISYCALCDGHFYKNQDILVVGGGNAALKSAIFLANNVKHLTLIHRRNQFRGNDKLVDELRNKNNVEILTPYVPIEILGSEKVEAIKIRNVETNDVKEIMVQGFFPLVGQDPSTKFIKIDGIKNEWGNIPVDKKMMTSYPGVFAGGDVLPREIRQIYLSEHDGMVAANSIKEYLDNN
mgnify:CR=1 FL=1